MCLGPHAEDAVEVVDVDVDKDSEESGQDLGADLLEVLGEGNSWGWRGMEEGVKILRAKLRPFPQALLTSPQHRTHRGRQSKGLVFSYTFPLCWNWTQEFIHITELQPQSPPFLFK